MYPVHGVRKGLPEKSAVTAKNQYLGSLIRQNPSVNDRQHFGTSFWTKIGCRERTLFMSDSTLKELWQQVAEKKSCEAKQKTEL